MVFIFLCFLAKVKEQFMIESNDTPSEVLPVGVKTQYKRYSQDYTVVLVPHDDPHEPYIPVGKHSVFLPDDGMSFLIDKPSGIPGVMPFVPWVAEFKSFLKKIDHYFDGADFEYVRYDWRLFAKKHLPTDALGNFTDNIYEYMDAGNFISSPLSNYMFDGRKDFRDYVPKSSTDNSLSATYISSIAMRTSTSVSSSLSSVIPPSLIPNSSSVIIPSSSSSAIPSSSYSTRPYSSSSIRPYSSASLIPSNSSSCVPYCSSSTIPSSSSSIIPYSSSTVMPSNSSTVITNSSSSVMPNSSSTVMPSSSLQLCGFEGQYSSSASSFDKRLIQIWHQDHESVEWRGMKKILLDWKIDHVNMLCGVKIMRGTSNNARLRDGIIVGYCAPNFNQHTGLFRIKFNDNSAEYHLPETDYKNAREEYLKSNPTETNAIDESRRCINLRATGRGRGGQGAGRGEGERGSNVRRGILISITI